MKTTLVFIAIILGIILLLLLVLNAITNHELRTEIDFSVQKEKVWEVLIDNEKYHEWNPFITSSKGRIKAGAQITNVMTNNGKATTFSPVITIFKENESFGWMGSGLGGMFKGNHYFKLAERDDGKSTLIHGEKFSGLLSGLILQLIGKDTQDNFVLMNEALKKRVEGI